MMRRQARARSTSSIVLTSVLTSLALAAACVAAAACGGPARPKAPAQDPQVAAIIATLDEALAARPTDGVLLYHRASTAARTGDPAAALPFLERLDATGWSVRLSPLDFGAIEADPRYRAIAARIEARDAPVRRSPESFELPGADLIPEGIAVDPATGTLYVGSLRKRMILAIDAQRRVTQFVPAARDGLMAVIGIRVDAARGLLWATSNGSPSMEGFAPADRGVHAIYAFALADGALRRRIALPPPPAGERHLLNDLAIGPDGTVYVTDSDAGRLYRIPPDREVLEPLGPPRGLFYPNGIVMAPSGKLYVAHATGIALVDAATGAATGSPSRLEGPPGVPLGGLDGMVLHDGALVAVQNAVGRPRLVRISLDERGERATAVTVLENDERTLELPTTTCIHDGHAYTLGNTQLDALGPDGLRKDRVLGNSRIVRTPLAGS
jgi:sugar lactone lactonase YvrE